MTEIFDDIRKIYNFSTPCPELADCIEFFSESSPEATRMHTGGAAFTVKMFPSWTPTCWFNLGCSYQLVTGETHYQVPAKKNILLLRDTITERRNFPADHIFTVKFHPGGFEKIIGFSQALFTRKVIDLETILPSLIIRKVVEGPSFDNRVRVLEQFFINRGAKQNKRTHAISLVKDSIASFEDSGYKFKNIEIASDTFTTSKTMNRNFHAVVGVSPKQYFSALRTRHTLKSYLADRKNFIPDEYGYYDISHFHKDVLKFTGTRLAVR